MDGKKWDGSTWETLGPESSNTGDAAFTGSGLTSLSNFTAYNSAPLAVTLASFEAAQATDKVVVTWLTTTELDNRGFNLWRSTAFDGQKIKLNDLLIPAQTPGDPYTWNDSQDLVPDTTYFYWLEDLDISDNLTMHPEPVSVTYVNVRPW